MTRNLLNTIIVVIPTLALLVSCGKKDPAGISEDTRGDEQARSEPGPLSAVVQTDAGQFVIKLRPDIAPMSVANFCNLADRGFYHGHEVSNANSVCLSIGRSANVPMYTVESEYSTQLLFDKPGVVAWTFVDTPEATEQFVPHPTRFFITIKPQDTWNLQYVPFGEIAEGQDVLGRMAKGDWIRSIRIVGDTGCLEETYAPQIDNWNKSLDAAGHPRAGADRTRPSIPLNSN